jgi:hypothetical protein
MLITIEKYTLPENSAIVVLYNFYRHRDEEWYGKALLNGEIPVIDYRGLTQNFYYKHDTAKHILCLIDQDDLDKFQKTELDKELFNSIALMYKNEDSDLVLYKLIELKYGERLKEKYRSQIKDKLEAYSKTEFEKECKMRGEKIDYYKFKAWSEEERAKIDSENEDEDPLVGLVDEEDD